MGMYYSGTKFTPNKNIPIIYEFNNQTCFGFICNIDRNTKEKALIIKKDFDKPLEKDFLFLKINLKYTIDKKHYESTLTEINERKIIIYNFANIAAVEILNEDTLNNLEGLDYLDLDEDTKEIFQKARTYFLNPIYDKKGKMKINSFECTIHSITNYNILYVCNIVDPSIGNFIILDKDGKQIIIGYHIFIDDENRKKGLLFKKLISEYIQKKKTNVKKDEKINSHLENLTSILLEDDSLTEKQLGEFSLYLKYSSNRKYVLSRLNNIRGKNSKTTKTVINNFSDILNIISNYSIEEEELDDLHLIALLGQTFFYTIETKDRKEYHYYLSRNIKTNILSGMKKIWKKVIQNEINKEIISHIDDSFDERKKIGFITNYAYSKIISNVEPMFYVLKIDKEKIKIICKKFIYKYKIENNLVLVIENYINELKEDPLDGVNIEEIEESEINEEAKHYPSNIIDDNKINIINED